MRLLTVIFCALFYGTNSTKYSKEFFKSIIRSLAVSPNCFLELEKFVANLNNTEPSWALEMIESNSVVPTGLVPPDFKDMGDFYKCTRNSAKYCLGYVTDFDDNSTTIDTKIWALCLPQKCTIEDTHLFGNNLLNNLLETGKVRLSFSELLCQTDDEINPNLGTGAIITITIIVLLVVLVLSSTIYDFHCIHKSKFGNSLYKSFSIYTNGRSIFKASSSTDLNHFRCLNGLKFFSLLWVIIVHQYLIPMDGLISNTYDLKKWPEKIYRMFVISGTLSIDTFLTIGGTLMSYGFFKARHQNLKFRFAQYYLHRYLRLTGALVLIVLISANLLKHLGSGPQWPIFVKFFQENCEENWWTALLYVQNYINPTKMCVGQTWYNDVDMQLCIISPFIFYILLKKPKIGFVVLFLCIICSMAASLYAALANDLPAIEFSSYSPKRQQYETQYYLLTHTRASTWILGVILGYYLCEIKLKETKLSLNKKLVIFFWFLAFALMLTCILGGHDIFLSKKYDPWSNACYLALIRPVWSFVIIWIIIACVNNYGGAINWVLSFHFYEIANKFIYSMYLISVTLLYGITYSKKQADYFTEFGRAYEFWGTLWFTFGLSILLVFVAEAPVMALEKHLLGTKL